MGSDPRPGATIPSRRPCDHLDTVTHRLKTLLLLLLPITAAWAAPYVPTSDAQVLERLPARATDPRARELLQLRNAWRRDPNDLEAACLLYTSRCV